MQLFEKFPDKDKTKWDFRFFNLLEWFSFLINNKKLSDKKIIDFFTPAMVEWYEEIFLKHADQNVIDDKSQFSELKTLYQRLKEN